MSLESLWMVISLTGFGVSLWGIRDAHRSVIALRNRTNGRRIVTRGYRRGEAITATVQLILVVMGIGPALDTEPVRLSGFVAALIAINALLLARSLFDARDRFLVRRAMPSPPETES